MAQRNIVIYTRQWCEDSQAAKEFLAGRGIPFEEVDIEKKPEAAKFVAKVNNGKQRTPTVQVGGRAFHCSPFNKETFTRELGLEG